MDTIKADDLVEAALRRSNEKLGQFLTGDVLALKAPMRQQVGSRVSKKRSSRGREGQSSSERQINCNAGNYGWIYRDSGASCSYLS